MHRECQAGHYYSRGVAYKALKYSEKNVNAQCYDCNMNMEGNKQGYRDGLIRKYGEGVLEKLESMKNTYSPWMEFEYIALIKHYQTQVRFIRKIILKR